MRARTQNVLSTVLLIGNPTNVIVGSKFHLRYVTDMRTVVALRLDGALLNDGSFAAYTAWCGLPALVAGCVACASLFVYYRAVLVIGGAADDAAAALEMMPVTAADETPDRHHDGPSVDNETYALDTSDAPPPLRDHASLLHTGGGDAVTVHWASAIAGSAMLLITLALMFGLSFIGVDVWIIGLAFGGAV